MMLTKKPQLLSRFCSSSLKKGKGDPCRLTSTSHVLALSTLFKLYSVPDSAAPSNTQLCIARPTQALHVSGIFAASPASFPVANFQSIPRAAQIRNDKAIQILLVLVEPEPSCYHSKSIRRQRRRTLHLGAISLGTQTGIDALASGAALKSHQ